MTKFLSRIGYECEVTSEKHVQQICATGVSHRSSTCMEAVLPDGHSQCIPCSAHTHTHTLCHINLCQPTDSTHFLLAYLLTTTLPSTLQRRETQTTHTYTLQIPYKYTFTPYTLTYTLQYPLQIQLTNTSYNEIVGVEAAERIPELRLSFDFFTVRKTVAYGPFF